MSYGGNLGPAVTVSANTTSVQGSPGSSAASLTSTTQNFLWSGAIATVVTGPSSALSLGSLYPVFTLTGNTSITAATVRIEASNDGVNFTGIATLSLTAPGSVQIPVAIPYPYFRANVIAIAGGSVGVTVGGSQVLTQTAGSTAAVNPQLSGVPATGWTTLASTGIQVFMPSNGTITAAGQLTLTAALNSVYKCWMYFPAGACFTSSPAGCYYVAMTSTTVGTVYTNFLTPGTIPYIPGTSNNPALGTAVVGPGTAYTQAAFVQLLAIPIPGNSMGLNGAIKLRINGRSNGVAATGFLSYICPTATTPAGNGTEIANTQSSGQLNSNYERTWRNCGATNQQTLFAPTATGTPSDLGVDSTALTDTAIDTTVPQWIGLCMFTTTPATTWGSFNGFDIQLLSQS